MDDPLDASRIQRALDVGMRTGKEAPRRIDGPIRVLAEISSTNDAVAEAAEKGAPEGLVMAAERQISGRGRKGAAWVAPPGLNLTFSVLLRPEMPPSTWPRLSHAAALAVANGLEPWLDGTALQLKWPNDAYCENRKLAGILVESRSTASDAFVVLGIGINVNSRPHDFPPNLVHTLTSVAELAKLPPTTRANRSDLCGAVLAELNRAYQAVGDDFSAVIPELERRSCLLGRAIRFRTANGWETGKMAGIGELGEMLVRDPSGELRAVLNAEEVRADDRR